MKFKDGWNNRVLIVDDHENIHQDIEEMLKPNISRTITDSLAKVFGSNIDENFLPDFELLHALNGKTAYEMIQQSIDDNKPIAVVYVDMRMPPGWDGLETIRKIREIDKNIEIVIMTAYSDKPLSEIIYDMELLHKLLYIRKPFAREEIQQMTISLVEKWNTEMELELNRQRLESVINSTRDSISMFDKAGNLVFANKRYLDMFELDEECFIHKSKEDLISSIKKYFHEPEKFEKSHESFFANPEGVYEDIVEIKGPERKMFYLYTAPVFDINEKITGRIIIYRDITKEIEIEEWKSEVLRLRSILEQEYSFDRIIGKSKKMQEIYALIHQASQSNINVLIQGESGTGKELIARAIHYNSSRKKGQFIAVNCAAIPETLIESELFGHEKGAFTGAASRKIGQFELANGGTILLDEIGEMHPMLQAKLLRVLQEREIQRVGGTTTIPVDVRVISSTNRDLSLAIKQGKFREDLFYRIAAFPINIPPLRERREDIPLLAEHFLNQAVEKCGKNITLISAEAMEMLINYDWPGNVRELENAIERAVLIEQSGVIQPNSLPPWIVSAKKSYVPSVLQSEDTDSNEIIPLDELEKQAIINALKITNNNIQQAAKALGINRATVYRKMEKYNIIVDDYR